MYTVETEFVTHRQWDDCAKRIERKNLNAHGRSITYCGIASSANTFIIEVQDDHHGMIVKKGWRQKMRESIITA